MKEEPTLTLLPSEFIVIDGSDSPDDEDCFGDPMYEGEGAGSKNDSDPDTSASDGEREGAADTGAGAGSENDSDPDTSASDDERESERADSCDEAETGRHESEPPEDPFCGLASSTPEMSLDVSDELLGDVAEEAVAAAARFKHRGDVAPYSVHPEAAAQDSVIIYDELNPRYLADLNSAREKTGAVSRSIANQIRRVLMTRAASRSQRDQHHGRLDRRKLHTLNRPGSKPNRRVFMRDVEGQSQDVVVGLLVDQSASMYGEKMDMARLTTVALADALNQLSTVGIQFGIWGFDSDWHKAAFRHAHNYDRLEPLRMHCYKEVDEDWRRVEARVGAMVHHANNVDGEAVRWAAHQLLQASASRRILMVLSDGAPAARTGRSPARLEEDLKRAVKDVEGLGVETIGLGMLDRSVKRFYPKSVVINTLSAFEEELMSNIRDTLLTR